MIPWSPTSAGSQMWQDTVVPVSQHRSDKSARRSTPALPGLRKTPVPLCLQGGVWKMPLEGHPSPGTWGSPGSLCAQSCPTLSNPVDYNK